MKEELKKIFDKAEKYVYRNARYLDVARWNYHFHDGNPDQVIEALLAYQNPDGGFGNRLEADLQIPDSTPIGTWTAITMLRELDFPVKSIQIVKKIIGYLESTSDFNGNVWTASIPNIGDYPHAPWWGYSKDNGYMQYNPTAEFVGIILRFGNPDSKIYHKALSILNDMTTAVTKDDFVIGAHELCNFLYMIDDIEKSGNGNLVPIEFKNFIRSKVPQYIEKDKSKYSESNYFTGPSFYITSKESRFYNDSKDIVDFYCEYLINAFKEEGYWDINWAWGEEPVQSDSLRDWRGAVTVNNMAYLKEFYGEE